jgi:hypothetical protein
MRPGDLSATYPQSKLVHGLNGRQITGAPLAIKFVLGRSCTRLSVFRVQELQHRTIASDQIISGPKLCSGAGLQARMNVGLKN